MLTPELITGAYNALEIAKYALFDAIEEEISKKEMLEQAKTQALMQGPEGQINGKNAEIRDAQLGEATKVQFAELKITESKKRECILAFDLASNRCSMYRDLLKLMNIRGM
jgi:hypothetical protein